MSSAKVALKILKVMQAIKSVSKDGFNSFHKYKYATDAAIVSEIREELITHKLACIPNQLACSVSGDITTLCIEYTLIDAESGEWLVTQVYGQGQDKGDKGVYKAATGAEKYFLLKTFLLPTDDDPENESKMKRSKTIDEEQEFNTGVRLPAGWWDLKEKDPQAAQERIGAGYYPKKTEIGWFIFTKDKSTDLPPPPNVGESLISHDEQLEVHRQAKLKGIKPDALKQGLKEILGVEGTAKITKAQYPKIIEWIIRFDAAEVGQ